jgi:hypothetical protein
VGSFYIHNRLGDDRAVLDTAAASGTQIHVDTARTLFYRHLEIPRRPLNGLKVRIGDQLYVEVPADLDQFWRDNSHGTVIGREGLVQLGHCPAYGGRRFQEIYVIAGIGQIKGRLHPCDTTSHNQYGPDQLI